MSNPVLDSPCSGDIEFVLLFDLPERNEGTKKVTAKMAKKSPAKLVKAIREAMGLTQE